MVSHSDWNRFSIWGKLYLDVVGMTHKNHHPAKKLSPYGIDKGTEI